MERQKKVIVIGGGVSGASCAYHLAKKGANVTLLEKNHFGAGASGCSAAMLEFQTHAYRGEPFLSLAKASMELFPPLYEELKSITGIDFEYERCGLLNLAMNNDDVAFFKECVDKQKKQGLRATWLEPEDVEKEFPQINTEYCGGAFYADDGQINGELFLEALLEGAKHFGAQLHENVGDLILGMTGEGVKCVSSENVFEADAYVVAAGAWTDQVVGRFFSSGIKPIRGQLLFYTTSDQFLKSPIFTRQHGYVVPKRRGFTMVGTTAEDVGFDNGTTDSARMDLIHKGQFLVPALSRCELRGISAGLRPKSKDELPLIGPLPGNENILLAAGHFRNGMLLAPITGEIISSLVLKQEPITEATPFSPNHGRFF